MAMDSTLSCVNLLPGFFVGCADKNRVARPIRVVGDSCPVRRPGKLNSIHVRMNGPAYCGHGPRVDSARNTNLHGNLRSVWRKSQVPNSWVSDVRRSAFGEILKFAGADLSCPDVGGARLGRRERPRTSRLARSRRLPPLRESP